MNGNPHDTAKKKLRSLSDDLYKCISPKPLDSKSQSGFSTFAVKIGGVSKTMVMLEQKKSPLQMVKYKLTIRGKLELGND